MTDLHQQLFNFIGQFITLTPEEETALRDLDLFHIKAKGEVILTPGQHADTSYFVLKGCLRTYYMADGEEKTTDFFTEMEVYTPPHVAQGTASTHYISCVEDSILLISNTAMEAEMNAKFPKFEIMCRQMAETLLARERVKLETFKTSTPEQRYQQLLQQRPDLVQRVPQYQLASYLGIQPQSLSRIRARLSSM